MNAAARPGKPIPGAAPAAVPGRISGFVFAIVAALLFLSPLFCLPFGAASLVQSLRALRQLPRGASGRGLVVSALVIAGAAMALTVMLAISAAVRLRDADQI